MSDDIRDSLIAACQDYVFPETAVSLLSEHQPLIISGVTAAGKNTVTNYLIQHYPCERVVTHTTRQMRDGEKDGVDYHFVSEAQMLELLKNGAMIEAKLVHGKMVYGTSIEAYKATLNRGKRPVLIIDVQGVDELASHVPNLRSNFILPPDFKTWMERLDGRHVMPEEEKRERLLSAKRELTLASESPNYLLVINRDFSHTAEEIMQNIAADATHQTDSHQLAEQLLKDLSIYQG